MSDEGKCGEFAASLVPRWGWFFSCVLPIGHAGEHRAGGECKIHGKYVMEHEDQPPQCPKWPHCAKLPINKEQES